VGVDPTDSIPEINEDNNEASKTISVNIPPVASFTASSTTIRVGKEVTFDASASADEDGSVTHYFFDFGDGTNSSWVSTPVVSHTYTTSGKYNVTLKVRDDKNAESALSEPIEITVKTKKERVKREGIPAHEVPVLLISILFCAFILHRKRE
jgi:PKD repeat protein